MGWRVEQPLGQDQAIGHDHGDVGGQINESLLRGFAAQRDRVIYRNTQFFRRGLDGAFAVSLAASGGAWGLGVDRNDVMPGGKGPQDRD